jgi:trehalose 6-phosphate phosphatase
MKPDSIHLPEDLARAGCLVLFLDYDGTLADFAPTPDILLPDQALIRLVESLAANPSLHVIILSGRRLDHVTSLLPVEGIWQAGSYGVELNTPQGARLERLRFDELRPVLDRLRPLWQRLIQERQGFYLEDKGWTLALHARFAEPLEAEHVLARARRQAQRAAMQGPFRVLGGDRFLEIAPQPADKGETVSYFLSFPELEGCLPVYLGDDDKDEVAFAIIQAGGGLAIKVGHLDESTLAQQRLPDPAAARAWLEALLEDRNRI